MNDSYQKIIDDMLWAAEMYCDGADVRRFANRLEALRAQPAAWLTKENYAKEARFVFQPDSTYTIPLIRAD